MAELKEVARRIKEIMAGAGGGVTAGAQAERGHQQGTFIGDDGFVHVRTWDPNAWNGETEDWGAWTVTLAPQWLQKAAGVIGDGGAAGEDPALTRLRMDQMTQEMQLAASEEARAAEMQPYDIAESQSLVQSRRVQEDVAQRDLERQMLSDRFARARDAFDAANLAEQLAVEKKRTATSFLTSIVDNLVPPGMEHPPGLGDQPWPTVAQIDWSQLGGGLDPQTDQAVQYLLAMQQQNQGV